MEGIDWHARAAALSVDGRMWIDGERVAAADGATFAKASPIDGRHLAQVARGGSADIDRAVAGARRAFEKGSWVAQPPAARKKVLLRFAEKLLASREELALLGSTRSTMRLRRRALGRSPSSPGRRWVSSASSSHGTTP